MKLFFTLVLLSIYLTVVSQWKIEASFPGEKRDDAVAFVADGFGYVGTGMNTWYSCTNDFYRYDVSSADWRRIADLPAQPRQYAAAVGSGGFGYVLGGVNGAGQELKDYWSYRATEDRWVEKANFPGTARSKALLLATDKQLFLFGGRGGANALNDCWVYNPEGDSWRQLNTMPFGGRFDLVGFYQFGSIYLGLGTDTAKNSYSDWWRFDPGHEIWVQMQDFPGESVTYNVALAGSVRNFVSAGSKGNYQFAADSWEYSVVNNSWHSFPVPDAHSFRGSAGFVLDNRFYLACGLDSTFNRLNTLWSVRFETPQADYLVYPNPSSEKVVIYVAENQQDNTEIQVFDYLGRNVQILKGVNYPYVLDVSGWPTGTYLIKTGKFQQKLIRP